MLGNSVMLGNAVILGDSVTLKNSVMWGTPLCGVHRYADNTIMLVTLLQYAGNTG